MKIHYSPKKEELILSKSKEHPNENLKHEKIKKKGKKVEDEFKLK